VPHSDTGERQFLRVVGQRADGLHLLQRRHAALAIDLEPLDVRRSVERERGVSWRTGVG
jgi:hypothetical protein